MNKISEKIRSVPRLYHLKGCSEKQIADAEKELQLKFPDEFIEYVSEFGAISFYGTEWTGLNVDGMLNVVQATNQEKALNSAFPEKCFVLENLGIDGIITIADESGRVYSLMYDKKSFICDTISEYLDLCIARSN